MRKVDFVNNEYYHIYNRGVDKRKIFLDKSDYFRFLHNLYEFNNKKAATQFSRLQKQENVGGLASNIERKEEREKLVNIICFCLMPNHFHLILEQLIDNGISIFMHKLGTGFSMSFNAKNKRSGSLFEGPFKAILIRDDTYLTHLSRYIHLNPVELKEKNWKKNGIRNLKEVNKFLENYRYSSYLDYFGEKNFPSIINKKLILEIFNNSGKAYKKFVKEWLSGDSSEKNKNLSRIKDIILE